MANTKTSGLTALTGAALDAGDYFPVLDSSASELKKVLASAVSLTDSGKTASFTAAAGYHYRVDMNSASADCVVTFPASPAIGDFFAYTLTRAHATYNLTINRNGNNVYGGTNVDLYTTKEAGHTSFWRWDSTSSGQGWIRMNEPKVNVQTFTANGTWVKPPGAIACYVLLIGGGGGGGSGRRHASGNRGGGGGGGAGGVRKELVPASVFGTTESVVVGAGGTGASAITTNDTSGGSGGAGNPTYIGNIQANGGGSGGGGSTGGGSGGFGANMSIFGASPASASFALTVDGGSGNGSGGGASGSTTTTMPSGGGGGGGVNSGGTHFSGGAGGSITNNYLVSQIAGGTSGTAGGTNGGAGNSGSSGDLLCGSGGGGGGGNSAGVAGSGGNGANYGSGGGGGGASVNSNNSGAGGNGGAGYAVIITFCR